MKINPGMPGHNVASASSNPMVDKLIELQQHPVKAAQARRDAIKLEKNEFNNLDNILGSLGESLNGIKTSQSFQKLKVESSHPDIMQGSIIGPASVGNYEFEVGNIASADKHLDFGFPDINKTEVGFGYMGVEDIEGNMQDVVIDPGSTLQDVAREINNNVKGVRASIVNTGFEEDPFRLLVQSNESGEAKRINIDPDTTFLDFKNIKAGKNLNLRMDDVDVTRATNKVNDLIDGLDFDIKRAEPGTKINVNVTHDVDKTMEGIVNFTGSYNKIIQLNQSQYTDNENGEKGPLIADGALRSVVRNLQREVSSGGALTGSKFQTMAQIGISTNAKTGELMVDETKLKQALQKDYDEVTNLFAVNEAGTGLASKLSDTVRRLQSRDGGVVSSRMSSLDRILQNQDQEIERKQKLADARAEVIRQQFQALDTQMAALQGQDQFLSAYLGSSNQQAPKGSF